jgi:maltose-binding protein MalE
MKRKNHWLLFAILLLSLTSLSPSLDFTQENSQKNNNKPSNLLSLDSPNFDNNHRPIRISVQLSEENFKILESMNERFVRETGIQSELSNVAVEMAHDEFSLSLAIGEGPDVLLMESKWVNTFATKGYLLPVESYLKNATGSDVIRTLLPTVEWNGYQWATPFDMDPYVLVWQPKTLVEMGIMEPPRTNIEWVNLLSKQADREGEFLLGMDVEEPYALATLMGGMGGDILHLDDKTLLWIEQALPYMNIVGDNKEEVWQLLYTGEIPLYISTYSEAILSWKEGLKVVLPESLYNNEPVFLRSRSFAVSSHTSLTDQSAEWIAYMTSSSIQQEWLEKTNRLPALNSIYENELSNGTDIPFELELLQSLNSGSIQSDQMMRPIWSELSIYVKQLLTGQITVNQFKAAMLGENVEETLKKD